MQSLGIRQVQSAAWQQPVRLFILHPLSQVLGGLPNRNISIAKGGSARTTRGGVAKAKLPDALGGDDRAAACAVARRV